MDNNRGLTLVEVLAAITILFIIGTAFFQFFIISQKGTLDSSEKLEALNLAQTVLERVKQGEYTEITGQGEYSCENSIEHCMERYNFELNNNRYDIKIKVEEDDLNLHLVTVYVSNENGDDRSSVKGLVDL